MNIGDTLSFVTEGLWKYNHTQRQRTSVKEILANSSHSFLCVTTMNQYKTNITRKLHVHISEIEEYH
jgi:hypothetical protein